MDKTMNIVNKISRFLKVAVVVLASALMAACEEKDENFIIDGSKEGIKYNYPGNRQGIVETRRVLLFYECGFNTLYGYLGDNMEKDLPQGYLPGGGRNEDVVLIYSKLALNQNYKDVPSYLRRIYKDRDGNVVSDTLKTFPASTVAASSATMKEVLTLVKTTFPAKGYGMVFSSHGSGWLPTGYYNSPSSFEKTHKRSGGAKYSKRLSYEDVPIGNMETDDPFAGMVRSLGQDRMSSGDVEMSVTEFAEGIPFHLDYLLFDMCFGGGVEVVYGLRDKADYLGVSPAEVLAAGMYDYTKLLTFLLKGSSPDLQGLFKDSFDRYNSKTGDYRSATVTLVKTEGLEELASVCRNLVEKYSGALRNAPLSSIQGYFRLNRHYFYDLEDTFDKCGASAEDLATLKDAIARTIVYKNATPSFLGDFEIKTYSGYSMYIPCGGTTLLNSYFKDEPWNKAVGLVK
jgi:hypothetical protein